MPVKKGQTLSVKIQDLAPGGKGIAKVDGFAIFVDQAAPEDELIIRITRKKKSWAEGRILEIQTPSPLRIAPPCSYAGWCGGCRWQFLPYDAQLEIKGRHVAEAMRHIALLPHIPVHDALPAGAPFEYRNKMEFSCTDRRWLLPSELNNPEIRMDFALGLHVPGTFHKVLDISRCLIIPDAGNTIISTVRGLIHASGLPPYGLRSHKGFWRFVMLRHSAAENRWMLNLITSADHGDAVRKLGDAARDRHPEIQSVVHNITARKAGIAVGETEIPLSGPSFITDRIGPYSFEISANSFFQTNSAGAAVLYDTVREYAALTGGEEVWDLYCGTGTIGIYLSEAAGRVTGIDLAASAIADARRNAARNHMANGRFLTGDIRDALAEFHNAPDVLIVDPPRSGLHKDVTVRILRLAPRRIVYVSCNPGTLARDLALLNEIYDIHEIQPVDMFPHTPHIESVVRLTRR